MTTRPPTAPIDQEAEERLVGIVDEAMGILSATADLGKHFSQEIDWMEKRKEIWLSRCWRIGLIGITSSGKSTLINALLGNTVFQVHVRPSSNCLVLCRRGPKQGIVHYEDGRAEVYRGRLIGRNLRRLADETSNPMNELGVKEIELNWPGFSFPDNCVLVDTPGLDAYGYDRHERLTMDLFLPTVDMAVFLTTAKANADGVIAQYLGRITGANKPLILAQNMIDSIEPKLGPGGTIQRSRQEVAQDHLDRLRKLLAGSGVDKNSATPIVQVSAKLAVRGELEQSGVPELVREVESCLAGLSPRLWGGRYGQLKEHLDRIITREECALTLPENREKRAEEELDSLSRLENSLNEFLDNQRRELNSLEHSVQESAGNFAHQAASLGPDDVLKAEDIKFRCEEWASNVPENFEKVLRTTCERIASNAQSLNLRSEDYFIEPPRAIPMVSLRIKTDTQLSHYRRKKKRGLLNKAIRFLGFGGYKSIPVYKTKLLCQDFQKQVDGYAHKQVVWADNAVSRVNATSDSWVEKILAEISRQRSGIQQQLQSEAKEEERRQALRFLRELVETKISAQLQHLPQGKLPSAEDRLGIAEQRVDLEVPKFILPLARLADYRARKRFLAIRKTVLNRIAVSRPGAELRPLLWSFDTDSLERFLTRFWFDVVRGVPDPEGLWDRIVDVSPFRAVGIGREAVGHDGRDIVAVEAKEYLHEPATIFLLLDAGQIGSTINQLSRSPIRPTISDCHGLVLVLQSIKGLEAGEAILELFAGMEELKLRPDAYLVNDDDAVLSVLVDRLSREGEQLRTHTDAMRLIGELLPDGCDAEKSRYYAGILMKWRENVRNQGG